MLFAYILGFITGATATLSFAMYRGKKILAARREALEKLTEGIETLVSNMETAAAAAIVDKPTEDSVKNRLDKVKDITETQLDLQARIEIPQKNSLDGKYKNLMSKQVKTLEEEKKDILNSILKDGFDPIVSVLTDDGVETMPLSQFMGSISPTEPEPKKERKFTVHSGGKDDTKPKE